MLNGIFTDKAFGLEALTYSFLQVPFIPFQAGSLGIFENEGIATTTLDLEFDSINMMIIPSTKRGAPEPNYRAAKRTVRSLNVPHFPVRDTIKPEEIQNVRLFGTNNQLQSAQSVVNRRLQGMGYSHDVTREYQMIGAIKGVIYDSDGTTVLYDLFAEFQVTQDTVDFGMSDSNIDLKQKCQQVNRLIEKAIGAAPGGLTIHAFCGDSWFDTFVAHPDVKDAYKLWQANGGQMGDFARSDNRRGFFFAGIYFENYSGNVGGVGFVPTGEAHFFPKGVPGLFQTRYAPANMMETVNTIGLPRYARTEILDMGRGVALLTESNVLSYCTRPKCLVKGTTS